MTNRKNGILKLKIEPQTFFVKVSIYNFLTHGNKENSFCSHALQVACTGDKHEFYLHDGRNLLYPSK